MILKIVKYITIVIIISASSCAMALNIVASIKPLHDIAAAVTSGITEIKLLVPPTASPHHYHLKPSQSKLLYEADLLIWVGPKLEHFLNKPVKELKAKQIMALNIPNLNLLANDPHIWLSPYNAELIAAAVSEQLSIMDPANASKYKHNLAKFKSKLNNLTVKLKQKLQEVSKVPFLVYHNAYSYFTEYYELNAVGAVVRDTHLPLGAKHLQHLHQDIEEFKPRCIFSEQQFNNKMLKAINTKHQAKIAMLDPLGVASDGYIELVGNIAYNIHNCLSQ